MASSSTGRLLCQNATAARPTEAATSRRSGRARTIVTPTRTITIRGKGKSDKGGKGKKGKNDKGGKGKHQNANFSEEQIAAAVSALGYHVRPEISIRGNLSL